LGPLTVFAGEQDFCRLNLFIFVLIFEFSQLICIFARYIYKCLGLVTLFPRQFGTIFAEWKRALSLDEKLQMSILWLQA
jgi:hypothetical protein